MSKGSWWKRHVFSKWSTGLLKAKVSKFCPMQPINKVFYPGEFLKQVLQITHLNHLKVFQYCTQRTSNFNEGNFLVYLQDKLDKNVIPMKLNESNRIFARRQLEDLDKVCQKIMTRFSENDLKLSLTRAGPLTN